ncbi:MAG: 50S ribosomal protein L15 [Candidatus Omnitrophica bacterium]|nr:50S ribosomal protein L15 [Candidatus Omnitrophota bacterium]HOX54734.1 50S ribosomal protein L15 [Candidatus Omnitrophota bacterium]
MQIHQIRPPKGAIRKRKVVGRGTGSGHGKTSGRGHKGQNARSGRGTRPGFQGGQSPLIKSIPKRGFTSKRKKIFQLVSLKSIAKFKEDAPITPEMLKEKGLINNPHGLVKILGGAELNKPLTVKAHSFSKSAEEKIKTSGGKIELINA